MKKIAFLGAALSQTPILLEARCRDVYCITLDNVPENPGHELSNKYIGVSTVDKERVLEALQGEGIDAIVSYASDVATTTAAYVAQKLGLRSNSLESTVRLTDKEYFRATLRETGLNTPFSMATTLNTPVADYLNEIKKWGPSVIVKPSDSAGTKGVSLVSTEKETVSQALSTASQFSHSGKLVIEQFIGNESGDVHGDGFVVDGRLIFLHLGDHLYDYHINGLNPVGTTWPSALPEQQQKDVHTAVQQILSYAGYRNGPINVEARFNSGGELYIMEIGPRNGGYFVPLAIELSSGFNLVSALMDQLLGITVQLPTQLNDEPVAYYAVHARENGKLEEVRYSEWLSAKIVREEIIRKPGSRVERFVNSSQVVSVLLLRFKDMSDMTSFSMNIDTHIQVIVA